MRGVPTGVAIHDAARQHNVVHRDVHGLGRRRALGLVAAPTTPHPHQAGRAAEAGQVATPDRGPILGGEDLAALAKPTCSSLVSIRITTPESPKAGTCTVGQRF